MVVGEEDGLLWSVDTSERAVVKRGLQRRRRSVAEKRRIVDETLESGTSVAQVAQRHAVNAKQVFHCRRLYRKGLLCEKDAGSMRLLPVAISDVPVSQTAQAAGEGARNAPSGTIQVELSEGTSSRHGPRGCGSIAYSAGADAGCTDGTETQTRDRKTDSCGAGSW